MSEDWNYKSPVNGQPTPHPALITSENAREYALKSAEVRRENGMIRNALLRELAKLKTTKDGREISGVDAMAESAIAMAMKNPRFWELVRDSIGEKPSDNLNINSVPMGPFKVHIGKPDERTDD